MTEVLLYLLLENTGYSRNTSAQLLFVLFFMLILNGEWSQV
jgi:hypothetical protein